MLKPARPRRFAALIALLLLGSCGGCEPPAPPAPLVWQSGETRVIVHESPFALEIAGAASTAHGERDCGALAVALRPADDEGTRYHRPDSPSDELVWLRAGDASRVAADELSVELLADDGEPAGSARLRLAAGAEGFVDVDVQLAFDDREVALVSLCFGLSEGEHVVGGGERFGGVDLLGHTVPLTFNAPGPYASTTNESHAPVPFFATSRGLGALFETERPGAFDVGDSQPGKLIARFHGARLPLRLRAGPVLDNAAAHARRMGLPPMPPRWVLAPQQWRNEHDVTVSAGVVTYSGQERVLEDAIKLRELDIPTTTLWIDAPWSTGHNTFEWNRAQFPDPEDMMRQLEQLGFRVIVWATEHLNFSDDSEQMFGMPPFGSLALYERFADEGWLVKDGAGQAPFRFPWGRGNGGYVDFTNDEAVAAYQELMRPLVRMGVRGFKLDYGEMMRPDLLGAVHNDITSFADGSTNETMHTRYARLYHEAYLGLLEEEHPGDWFVITRTGGIFDQHSGVALWPGDLDNDLRRHGEVLDDGALAVGGLPAAVSAGLSASLSGYPLYGSDIGGYRGGVPTREVLLRWAQFGAVSTVMQLGGGGTGDATHNPWDPRYGEGAADIYRRYARLHMDLLPTFEALVHEAVTTGRPPLVPVGVHMRDDEEAWADEETFLLGGDLLAAPVVDGSVERTLRLPEGVWLDWWRSAEHEGPATLTVAAPLDELPFFQRAGSVVLLGHPWLDTAVPGADPTVAVGWDLYDSNQDAVIARTSAGPDGEARSLDGVVVTQRTSADEVTVSLAAPNERLLGVELRLRASTGPRQDAEVRVEGRVPALVGSEDEALGCEESCLLREPDRLLVIARASALHVVVGSAP